MIRDATTDDATACAAIYAPYVTDSAISFELEAPSAAEMASRIEHAHTWLVLEEGGRVVGYAYGGPFRERLAYARTTEVSVYLGTGRQRTGRPVGTFHNVGFKHDAWHDVAWVQRDLAD